jgi:hypothetical protein
MDMEDSHPSNASYRQQNRLQELTSYADRACSECSTELEASQTEEHFSFITYGEDSRFGYEID